jgi:hypothetical protein
MRLGKGRTARMAERIFFFFFFFPSHLSSEGFFFFSLYIGNSVFVDPIRGPDKMLSKNE